MKYSYSFELFLLFYSYRTYYPTLTNRILVIMSQRQDHFISDIPQLRFFTRKVLFIDRVTGQDNNFEGVITKVIYDQTINTTSIKTSVMETSIETRILKVGDLIIIKEDQILYKGTRFQHVFIFLTIDLTKTYGQLLGMRFGV